MRRKLFFLWMAMAMALLDAVAQEDVLPRPFAVYGGTIGVIDAIALPGNKTRLFVSTDSANSIFYAEVDHNSAQPLGAGFVFNVLPDMDASANFGTPLWIAAHAASGKVFAGTLSGLVSCAVSPGTLTTLMSTPMAFILIRDNIFLAIDDAQHDQPRTLYHGVLDTLGNLTLGASPSTNFFGRTVALAIHPTNDLLYVLASFGDSFTLVKSSDAYNALGGATVFTPVPIVGVVVSNVGQIAFGPDGRLFLGGRDNDTMCIAWSDDDGATWTNIDTMALASGVGAGLNIVCNGTVSDYAVYFGTALSTNRGADGSWLMLPLPGGAVPAATHVNAGCTAIDPQNQNFVYLTTDKGVGGSTNAGRDLVELNNGLLAFQINDIDALSDKTVAWLASKAGVRIATNFNVAPAWYDADFPDAIANCVAVDADDITGMTGYVGSHDLYRTTTGGGSNLSAWICVFNRDDYFLPDGIIKSVVAAGDFLALGYHSFSDTPAGGVFVSTNGGLGWDCVVNDVDANNLLLSEESGAPVVYAAIAKYKTGATGGVYRIDASSAMLDLADNVNIRDLAKSPAGYLLAAGTVPETDDPARHRVVVYYKDTIAATSTWCLLPTNGLPGDFWDGEILGRDLGPSITIGTDSASNEVPVLAALRTIYYLPFGGAEWTIVTNYPVGTQIKTLFWDELMVGTTIGLYGQGIDAQPLISVGPNIYANSRGGSLVLPAGTPVTIFALMDADQYAGIPADWWLVAIPHAGAYWYYLNHEFSWTPFAVGNLGVCRPVYQGALVNVPATPVLSNYLLPRGVYDFYFAVDQLDGILNYPNGPMLWDMVSVVVE